MEIWVSVISVFLVLAILIIISSVYYVQKTNTSINQNNILYPFSSSISPGSTTANVLNSLGTSQIDCSAVGGKINIVGAWSEISDPFGECSNSSNPILNLTCGIKGNLKVPCNNQSDCGPGMSCTGNVCIPASCPLDPTKPLGNFDSTKCSCGSSSYCPIRPGSACNTPSDCNDPNENLMSCTSNGDGLSKSCTVNSGQVCAAPDMTYGQFCSSYPLCSNTQGVAGNVTNKICDGLNPNTMCRPRDVSAYLAGKCDGQTTCNLTYDPQNPNSGFGPAPCNNSVNVTSTNYTKLPIIPGQGGSQTGGFGFHGIYTCVV